MDSIVLNNLYAKNELYYNENIHSNMISKILSVLIDKFAERLDEQDEYFIQAKINDFLNNQLRNSQFFAHREWKNIDNVVSVKDSNEPLVLYEVKTYIKKSEKKINPNEIYKDILKLAIQKYEKPHLNAYMLIAGKTNVAKDAFSKGALNLPNKFENIYNRNSIVHDIDFFMDKIKNSKLLEKAKKLNIKQISISPSRWKNYNGVCVLTWRINKNF
jgi:hypothetical protein